MFLPGLLPEFSRIQLLDLDGIICGFVALRHSWEPRVLHFSPRCLPLGRGN